MEKEKKYFIDVIKEPQNIIAIGVTIISLCALVVSIMQTRIMSEQRKLMFEQSKAAVWPRLDLFTHKSHNLEDKSIILYSLNIVNAGVGPAIVTDMKVSYNNVSVKNWGQLFRLFKLEKNIPTYRTNNDVNNSIIRIGEEFAFLDLSKNLQLANSYFKMRENIKYEIWYKSIYGDKWKVTFENENCRTEKVDNNFKLPQSEQFEG